MKKQLPLFLSAILIVALLLYFDKSITIPHLATDSGFDTSYDSGGDYGGSYSGDSGGVSQYSVGTIIISILVLAYMIFLRYSIQKLDNSIIKHSKPNSILGILLAILFIALLVVTIISLHVLIVIWIALPFLLLLMAKINEKKNQKSLMATDVELTEETMTILDQGYQIFYEVQMSWMNFDYKALKSLVTDELYNMYCNQLETLKLKGQQNIMSDFVIQNKILASKKRDGHLTTYQMKFVVSFYDYIIDENEEVIRGNDQKKVTMTYLLTFVCDEGASDCCPHCGAPLPYGETICSYCHTKIQSVGKKLKLSKKEVLNQRND